MSTIWKIPLTLPIVIEGWFPYDRRRSQIAESSAIIWKHTSAIVCDRDRRRWNHVLSSAIACDHMEVLRSAIETYPIIFLILTDDSKLQSHKARMFVSSNVHLF